MIKSYALGYNSTSIKITWQPPKSPNGIVGYRVYQWGPNDENKFLNNSILIYNGLNTLAYATNLEQDRVYWYQIIPYNLKYGYIGIPSKIINGTSHEDGKYFLTTNVTTGFLILVHVACTLYFYSVVLVRKNYFFVNPCNFF